MSTEPSSMEKAVADAAGISHADLGGAFPDAVQLSMLADANGNIPHQHLREVRRGRPPNALNKRNKKFAQWFVQKYGDPADALGNMASMPLPMLVQVIRAADDDGDGEELDRIERIIDRLGDALSAKMAGKLADKLIRYMSRKKISALDVAQMQVGVLRDMQTYVHGRQPLTVEVAGKTDAFIIIPGINAPMDVPMGQLEDALTQKGMDAIDFENMRMIGAPEEADYEPVPEGGDGE